MIEGVWEEEEGKSFVGEVMQHCPECSRSRFRKVAAEHYSLEEVVEPPEAPPVAATCFQEHWAVRHECMKQQTPRQAMKWRGENNSFFLLKWKLIGGEK